MSQQYHGALTAVTSSGTSVQIATGRGTFVAAQATFPNPQPGYMSVIDSQVSTATGGKKLTEIILHSASTVITYQYIPTIPVAYQGGLFVNASGTNSVIVNYIPLQNLPP